MYHLNEEEFVVETVYKVNHKTFNDKKEAEAYSDALKRANGILRSFNLEWGENRDFEDWSEDEKLDLLAWVILEDSKPKEERSND